MHRVMLCGCGGSGKSALARELAQRLKIPATHLDMEYYGEDWETLDQESFAQRQRDLVTAREWILDGNYAATMPIRLAAADLVVFLDLPACTCLWGVLQRRRQHRGTDTLSRHLRGRLSWSFIRYILTYRRTMRPRVEALIAEHATGTVTILRSRRETQEFLQSLQPLSESPCPGESIQASAFGPE